ncbi:hypothetical protein PVK06_014857 [Gossypium arboreum]|uniref:Neprosin PEP catalytic domain-containing protein n=1 Tax=Gossypium arboreum TaxID=29729 RepID=A0ABR0PW88_GOSAR|nr:hypothetical protein PVK06_014857 [Gossypium arboreum]
MEAGWQSDGYQRTGCYNPECPGFVQTSNKLGLGGKIEPVSTYAGEQIEMSIYMHKVKHIFLFKAIAVYSVFLGQPKWKLVAEDTGNRFRLLARYMNESEAIKDAENVLPNVTNPECYDLQMGNLNNFGTHFFYDGPGYSDKCL